MKYSWVLVLSLLPASIWAGVTVVYQSDETNGTPMFTNIPSTQTAVEKEIYIPNDPISPAPPAQSQSEQEFNKNIQNLDQDLQVDQHEAQLLKDRLEASQSSLESAEAALQQAQAAMSRGDYKIGNDTVIDDRYIRMLEINKSDAEQQVAADQENYTNFVNQMD